MYKLLLFFGILLMVTSCSTSKFDYQSAYRFSYQQGQQGEKHTGGPQEPSSAKASDGMQVQESEQLEVSLQPVAEVSHATPDVVPISKESFVALTKTEKRAVRQQVKQDLKALKKDFKKAEKEAATQDIVFNKKMYIGLVIFAAGILVAILASGPVGAIGIIVGIGLIAWGFIEQA